jgi:hypothetical protein
MVLDGRNLLRVPSRYEGFLLTGYKNRKFNSTCKSIGVGLKKIIVLVQELYSTVTEVKTTIFKLGSTIYTVSTVFGLYLSKMFQKCFRIVSYTSTSMALQK